MTTKTFIPKAFPLPLYWGLLALGIGCLSGLFFLVISDPLKAFVILAGIMALVVAFVQIEWGLVALVLFTYTNLSDIAIKFHGAPSIAKFFVPYLLLAILVRWAVYRERPVGWLYPTLLIALYGLCGLTSLSYATDLALAQERLSIFVKNLIIIIVVIVLLKRAVFLRRVTWALLLAGMFMGTITLYQYLTGNFESLFGGYGQGEVRNIVDGVRSYRLAGPIGDSNFYAQIMVVLVPLAFNRMLDEKKLILRVFAGWAFVVTCSAVILTFSRGAFIALMAVLILSIVRRPLRMRHYIIMLLVAGISLFFLPKEYKDRVKTLGGLVSGGQSALHEDVAFQGRAAEMLVAVLIFADHPLLGIGVGNFRIRYPEYARQLGIAVTYELRSAHSLFLEIAAERGIIGLSIYLAILYMMFQGLRIARAKFNDAGMPQYSELTAAYAVAMIGFLTAAIFLHQAYPRFFWLMMAISLALPNVAQRELEVSRDQ